MVRVRLTKLRPLSGSCLICSSVTVVDRSELDVWTSGVVRDDLDRLGHGADFELHVGAHALVDADAARSTATRVLKPLISAVTV